MVTRHDRNDCCSVVGLESQAGFIRRFEGRDDSGGNVNNRFILAAVVGTQKLTHQAHTIRSSLVAAKMDWRSSARQTLMALGMLSIAVLVMMFIKPELTDHFKALSPFEAEYDLDNDPQALAFADMLDLSERAGMTPARLESMKTAASPLMAKQPEQLMSLPAGPAPVAFTKEQQLVTTWLARRYRIAGSASKMLVESAYASAHEVRIDPLLILAVMAIESRFNPFAESAVGAQGLMQVMAKVHHDKFVDQGGVKSALNPAANIKVGALILKDYVRRAGSVEAGLKLYVGAGNLEGDGGYGGKVVAEYQRLQAVASGKRVPTFTPPMTVPAGDELHEAKAERPAPVTKETTAEPA